MRGLLVTGVVWRRRLRGPFELGRLVVQGEANPGSSQSLKAAPNGSTASASRLMNSAVGGRRARGWWLPARSAPPPPETPPPAAATAAGPCCGSVGPPVPGWVGVWGKGVGGLWEASNKKPRRAGSGAEGARRWWRGVRRWWCGQPARRTGRLGPESRAGRRPGLPTDPLVRPGSGRWWRL